MKVMVTRALCLVILMCTSPALAVLPYLTLRSQGFNAARELVGWQTTINKGCVNSNYSSFSITPEYTRSFRSACLSDFLFGDAILNSCSTDCVNKCSDNNCGIIKIQGSQVIGKDPHALMAENFYLPTDFSSVVSIEPQISNWLIDFNWYLGLDCFRPGVYFRVHSPLVYTKWNLNYCERVINSGIANYSPGYFNDTYDTTTLSGINRSKLLNNFTDYAVNGNAISGIPGITYQGLDNAMFSNVPLHKTRLAELTAALGWNFIACPHRHMGIQIRAAAPTGNRPNGHFLFEPIVGNGHHWELGAGFSAHSSIYSSDDECNEMGLYVDVNVTHLFKTRQCRTFDLAGNPLSRYMLATKFTSPAQDLRVLATETLAVAPDAQFADVFAPVANLTTIPVEVSAPVHVDAVLKLAFTHRNFQCDVGYNFWYRSCTKFNTLCSTETQMANLNNWGLKGDAWMYGFALTGTTVNPSGVALSATESNATIFGGTNVPAANGTTIFANTNPGIDNPTAAYNGDDQVLVTYNKLGDFASVNTSYQPVLLNSVDFDFDGARSRGLSHKIFFNFEYLNKECECYEHYVGIGGEVEFAQRCSSSSNSCFNCALTNQARVGSSSVVPCSCHQPLGSYDGRGASKCTLAALSQWGIWLKAGVAYN